MPKGYWVVFADVTDPEGYKGYMAANAKALAKHGGRFLARRAGRLYPEAVSRHRPDRNVPARPDATVAPRRKSPMLPPLDPKLRERTRQ